MKKIIFVLLIANCIFSQSQITKDDVKKIKSLISEDVKINPDYVEHKIWVETHNISFMGIDFIGTFGEPANIHKFYFLIQKDSAGKFICHPIRYKLILKEADWLFAEKILVVAAESNKKTRTGEGVEFEIQFPAEERIDKIISVNNLTETIDIRNEAALKWIENISSTGNFSRLRIYGSNNVYRDAVIRGKDMQKQAVAILNSFKTISELK